ncbi:MAG: DUF2142 domain-containing protein [Acidimicrobiales bacterium]
MRTRRSANTGADGAIAQPPSRRRELVLVFAAVFVASSLWALASPLMSVPDEPAHATKAAAIWDGWWRGTRVVYPKAPGDDAAPVTFRVRTTESYASANKIFMCYALQPAVTADCAPKLSSSDRMVRIETSAGSYPPLYYALVGWPSKLVSANVGLYLMRLVSAALCAAMFTLGYAALRRVTSSAVAAIAVIVAATPEVLFLAGSVNPNSLEIAAAFAMWGTALALALTWSREQPVDRRLVAGLLVSTTFMAHSRTLSPLFAVIVLGLVALFAGRARLMDLARDKRFWAVAVVTGALIASAMIWIISAGHLDSITGGRTAPGHNVLVTLVALSDNWFSEMIAYFGWLDAGPVALAIWIWLALVVLVVALAAGTGRAWRSTVLLLTVAAVVVGPIVLQYPSAKAGHIIWQGRYILPIAMGVPVLAAVTLDTSQLSRRLGARVLTAIAAFATVAMVASHMSAMRRYVVGVEGPVNYLSGGAWSPPLPALLLLALTVAVGSSVTVLVNRIAPSAFGGQDVPPPSLVGDPPSVETSVGSHAEPSDGADEPIDMRNPREADTAMSLDKT